MKNNISQRAFANTHDIVFKIVEALSPLKILDAAAGPGALSQRLDDARFNVIASDIDEEQFVAQEIPFVKLDLNHELPFDDKEFDCVLCVEAYEHLRNPGLCLSEFHRILKKDGILVVTFPNITSLISRFIFLFTGAFQNFKDKAEYCTYDRSGADRHILPVPAWLMRWHLNLANFDLEAVNYSKGGFEIHTKRKRIKIPFLPGCKMLGNTVVMTARRKG